MPNKNSNVVNDGYRQSGHRWPSRESAPQETPQHTTKLFDVVRELGEVRASIDHLETASRETRTDLKAEAAMIKDALDEISRRISTDYKAHDVKLDAVSRAHDARLDAIEIHLARQDAEAAGFKRALRVGGALLSGASVAFGWLLSQAGGMIFASLGLGGK